MTIDKIQLAIGERIRNRRIELDMSQAELGEKLGYTSRSAITNIEKGRNQLRQSKIKKIADALDTTPAYLMGWTENTSDTEEELAAEEDFELLQKYNKLSDKNKQIVLTLIDSLLSAQ